jgi:S-adenosylmethionine-dependent methyltransferase
MTSLDFVPDRAVPDRGPEDLWTPAARQRAEAYLAHARGVRGEIRFDLVTRALAEHLPRRPCRIADIGGGYGRQAILLARMGHSVVILDRDETLLRAAEDLLASEEPEVRARVDLVPGAGENAPEAIGTGFDLVCCHSVLMYLADPRPMLRALVLSAAPGALISVLCPNRDSIAMRDGLQGRWREALASLTAGDEQGGRYLRTRADTPADLGRSLAGLGAPPTAWYGVRIFSDHLEGTVPPDEFADLSELEWQAGQRDPYRSTARLFHLVARREGLPQAPADAASAASAAPA